MGTLRHLPKNVRRAVLRSAGHATRAGGRAAPAVPPMPAKKPWWEKAAEAGDRGRRPRVKSGGTGANKAVLLAEAEAQDWQVLTSSNVKAAAYAEDFHRLYVEFGPLGSNPSLYVYHDVPPAVYQGLLSAPSKGRYVFDVVRNGGRDDLYGFDQLY